MKCTITCENPIPYLKNGDNKVILDFSIDQHECSYYIDIWNVLCGAIQAANNMEAFPYGNTLFAVGVKLNEEKSYSVILTKYNLYVLGFADFNEGLDEIPRGSMVVIFDIATVAYPMHSPKINIKDADILIPQFRTMYYFWEKIKNNPNSKYAIELFKGIVPDDQNYFISFLVVVWFISEAAREETGRIAWLINLKSHQKISDTIVNSIPVLAGSNVVQSIHNNCPELFIWEDNRNCIFTNWNTIAREGTGPQTNYITVRKIAAHYHIASSNIVETLNRIFRDQEGNSL